MKNSEIVLNHNICEIRFKPNPNIMDNKGLLTDVMTRIYDLEHWGIGENGVEVFDENKRIKISVAFDRMSISIYNDIEKKEFKKSILSLCQIISSMNCLADLKIKMIGIRTRNCLKYDNTFNSLFKELRDKYMPVPKHIKELLDFEIYDVGYPLT